MKAWQRRSFTVLAAIVIVTGVVYFWMKDLLTPADPFAVINHPLQPLMQRLHVLAAPAFLVAFGMIVTAHVTWKLRNGRQLRLSGLITLITIGVMTASGYLLQVAVDETWRRAWVVLHLASGGVFIVSYAWHFVMGVRRSRAREVVRT